MRSFGALGPTQAILGGGSYAIGAALPLAVLYVVLFATVPGQIQTPVFWGTVVGFAFLHHRRRGVAGLIDVAVAVLALGAGVYAGAAYYREETIAIFGPSPLDAAVGLTAIAVVIYASWRFAGAAITLLPVACLAYLGWLVSDGKLKVVQVVRHMFLSTEGIFGVPLYVCVTVVFVFMLFSAILERSGAGSAITTLATKLVGRAKGGPAKVAVVSSAAFGTITGAAVANVMADGTITIPLMKRIGFSPARAAAIEAVASTGSQLAPPVMGAAAFLMAEVLGIPYLTIALAAIVPTIFFYCSLYGAVHIWSLQLPSQADVFGSMPSWRAQLGSAHLLLPIAVLILSIAVFATTPAMAAAVATVSVLLFANLRRSTRFSVGAAMDSLEEATERTVSIAAVCGAAGIVVGTLTLTGLGQWIISGIINLSGGNLLIALVLTMVTSIVLGMGLPTISVYIILVVTVAPVLVQLGVPVLAAHMFIFYYGVLAVITPPVAMAVIAASSIAGSDIWKSGREAVRLAFLMFIQPFMFVYRGGILLQKDMTGDVADIVATLVLAIAGTVSIFGYLFGKLSLPWRAVFAAAALLALFPGYLSDIAGLVLLIVAASARWVISRPVETASENQIGNK